MSILVQRVLEISRVRQDRNYELEHVDFGALTRETVDAFAHGLAGQHFRFTIDIDGSAVSYAHGPPRIFPVQFPGPRGRRQIRAFISPAPPSGANAITFDGPWAPLRMFDSIEVRQTPQPDRFEATIVFEDRRAVFEIRATSVRNPFYLPELTEFRCPVGL